MDPQTARNTTKGIAIVFWVGVALLIYQAVDLLFFTTGALAYFAPYMAFFGLALAAVLLVVGTGVWRSRPWGRMWALTLGWITLAFLAIALVADISDPSAFAWRQVAYLVFAVVIIWSLQFQKDVKAQFASA